MPVIEIWCLPPNQKEEDLNRLHKTIVSSVLSIRELNLKSEKDMTCLFPPDLMRYGLGDNIVIKIYGLFERPERTGDVLQRLAKNVGAGVSRLYPKSKIECFVFPFNPSQGFWSSGE